MPRLLVTGVAVTVATLAIAVECGLAGVAMKTATVAATPAPAASTAPTPSAATAATASRAPAVSDGGAARPASVPATGDVWVCQFGVGGPGGLAPNQTRSEDCQTWGAQHGIAGTAVRTQVATYETFAHCGHWDVHQVHLDSNLEGPNANIAHYDQDWKLIPSGVC